MKQVIIVGFGCAGYHAAKALREAGFTGLIHVFTDCEDAPVNPMLTTYYIDGKIPLETMLPFGGLSGLALELDLIVHTEARITSIDFDKKLAVCDDGVSYPYDKLLLATGASAQRPPVPGSGRSQVYTMRTKDDAVRLNERLDSGGVKNAVVVGASMVGIKVAEVLVDRGIETTIGDNAEYIFPLAALPDTAKKIEDIIRSKGVELLFGSGITGIIQKGSHLNARFSGDIERDCDLVVLCTGVRANTQLAGERVETRRGIVADERMRTNVPDVYAAGDCVESFNIQSGGTSVIGLWASAASQGEIAGKNMAGLETRCAGNIIQHNSHFFDMDFVSCGDNKETGKQFGYESPDGRIQIRVVADDKKILCFNILNQVAVSGILKGFLIKRLVAPEAPLGYSERIRLRDQGLPGWFIQELEFAGSGVNANF